MHWGIEGILWLLAGIALAAVASAVTFQLWHRFASRARGRPGYALPRAGPPTPLDQIFNGIAAAHSGKNRVMTLLDNADAFAARAHSARQTGRSLDVMTYIWRTDMTGWLLLGDVLAAADRGARVRLLLDDIHVQGFDPVFLALNTHRNIEVRLFNPIRNRGHVLRRALEAVLGMTRYNRRLHSKAWIADGRMAIVGGRNIGDTYFGRAGGRPSGVALGVLRPRVSRDADLMLAGPAVSEIETVFDGYWNLGLVLPITALWPGFRVSLRRFRRQVTRRGASDGARAFIAETLGERDATTVLTGRMHWSDHVRVLADPPDKALGRRMSPWMAEQVHQVLAGADHDVRLITPYFVPGEAGLAELTALTRRGVNVSLLTNGLAASDNIFVHGAYRHYRAPLLEAGARIFEFAPPAQDGQKRDVLHSKVFLIDGRRGIVGSLNFDMRSAHTNAELGVLFEQPDLVAELQAAFDQDSDPNHAYALSMEGSRIRWAADRTGAPPRMSFEPESPVLWRAVSWTVGHLPIHSWL